LSTSIVNQDLDGFDVVDPFRSMKRRRRNTRHDAPSICGQPRAECTVGQRQAGALLYINTSKHPPIPTPQLLSGKPFADCFSSEKYSTHDGIVMHRSDTPPKSTK